VRTRSDQIADDLDPRIAERIIQFVLGEQSLDDVDGGTYFHTQLLILAALVADEQFDDIGLDGFMAEVRTLADEWTREPGPTGG
jgi:hypothetical protein